MLAVPIFTYLIQMVMELAPMGERCGFWSEKVDSSYIRSIALLWCLKIIQPVPLGHDLTDTWRGLMPVSFLTRFAKA